MSCPTLLPSPALAQETDRVSTYAQLTVFTATMMTRSSTSTSRASAERCLAIHPSLRTRALVHASIMPAYPWLFVAKNHPAAGDVVVSVPPEYAPHGKVVVATHEEQDLVAYLKSLKQPVLPSPAPTP
jgi:hypothetical protein